ncbi:MAG: DUF1015 family protein [Sulfuritalea sp.]|nr:DUF1015 family protein [Sulfuritalea sp.]
MSLIRAFRGLRPAAGQASAVAAPPYDVLSSTEARERAAGKPWSFLHISKPEIDLPPDTDPYAPEVYAKATENLKKMIAAGVLIRDEKACYYAYRLTMPSTDGVAEDHVQTGLVAAANIADYDSNRIRKHEFTRPDKEDDRVRQIDALNAQTGPVLLAYPASSAADDLIDAIAQGEPISDVTADDGIRHQIWILSDTGKIEAITQVFDVMPALYIADGHHRSAAASRVAAARHQSGPDASADSFLSVIFPHHQMKILDYNRVVKDLRNLDEPRLLDRLGTAFVVEESAERVHPAQPGEFGMFMDGRWYKLSIKPDLIPDDPVDRLDVSLLSNHLLAPLLEIHDLRRDKRIDFVGGIRGLAELEKRVNSGEMAVAFALHATHMDQLMAVADSNNVMPPKSTWFEPKLADGLISHVLD